MVAFLQCVAPANEKCSVMSLPGTATAAILDLKGEDIVVQEVVKSGVDLTGAKEAYKVLIRAMKSLRSVSNVAFQVLLEVVT